MSAHADVAAHKVERLAEARNCSVYRCAAGCLHLQIGAATLRVTALTLGELSEVVSQAHLYLLGASDRYAH
jgi:hypothetical protein